MPGKLRGRALFGTPLSRAMRQLRASSSEAAERRAFSGSNAEGRPHQGGLSLGTTIGTMDATFPWRSTAHRGAAGLSSPTGYVVGPPLSTSGYASQNPPGATPCEFDSRLGHPQHRHHDRARAFTPRLGPIRALGLDAVPKVSSAAGPPTLFAEPVRQSEPRSSLCRGPGSGEQCRITTSRSRSRYSYACR